MIIILMERFSKPLSVLFLICMFTPSIAQRHLMRLNDGWKFSKGEFSEGAEVKFNDKQWQNVSVPHDWAITGPFDKNNDMQVTRNEQDGELKATEKTGRTGALPYYGIGWYRLRLKAQGFTKGKQAILRFDGAMSNASVYVNGKKAGNWAYGYSSFWLDVSDLLSNGENVLAVRLDNKPESSRWYPGAGLYRNVYLEIKDRNSIKTWGTYITTDSADRNGAVITIRTTLDKNAEPNLRLETTLLDPQGTAVAKTSQTFSGSVLKQEIRVEKPGLWSPETPYLYTAVSKVFKGSVQTDEYRTRFGIRTIEIRKESGFYVNGQLTKFKGVCNHHDLGPLGAAINVAALRRQLVLLKEMGSNAIRTSHNPPAPELLDLCDEMGFLVINESFDEWKRGKMKNGYNLYFDEWAEKDLVNFIHRDRNHPSVIMWSIGNEINEQSFNDGKDIAKYLQDICHREDPTRPVTAGMDRFDAAVNNGFAAMLDVPGFNYKPSRYSEAYRKLPQKVILGSETASTVSSRGVYKFPVQEVKQKTYEDRQSSSYDLEACSWSQTPDEEFVMQDSLSYMLGEFVWTGFDYLGEPTPYNEMWPSRSSYFGIIDLAGIPKDRYYLYKSRWNPSMQTLHLLPHWTWPGREGQTTPVFCYTNYPAAELFVNGKSQGIQTKSKTSKFTRYRLMWPDVKYEPGTIKVVAFDEAGRKVASEEIKTAGKPHHIELNADRKSLLANGEDLSYITVKVVDENGTLCPTSDHSLRFRVKGNGNFRVACNGDPTSLEEFHVPQMKVFNGMLVVTVQTTNKPGEIELEVDGEGLKSGIIAFESK
ncbi:beta-galactosidase GalB [Desertivirga xinjiangensis]|uniref:beta-galactosidase GalB n=1 Tax=Desertivirga xinjiangensis TaxID=539206 RepID=UPI00210BF2ED|nr:beta-galactosidase GalB [Pedobacter xinjiangensis]